MQLELQTVTYLKVKSIQAVTAYHMISKWYIPRGIERKVSTQTKRQRYRDTGIAVHVQRHKRCTRIAYLRPHTVVLPTPNTFLSAALRVLELMRRSPDFSPEMTTLLGRLAALPSS